eukprot:Em0022g60a
MSALLRSCRGVFRSHALLQPCVRQCRRSAFTLPKDPTLNALIWVGVGMTGVTSFLVYKSATSPKHSTGMSGHRVKQYSNSGAVHPEAQTEKLMVEKAPPTPEVPQSVAEPTAASADQVPRLPEHVPYVLIGAGTASFAAAKAILEKDPAAKILIVGEEGFTPYSRPPLSKQLWFNEDHEAARQLKYQAAWAGGKVVDAFYKMDFCDPNDLATKTEGGVAVLRGKKAVSLDPAQKKVVLDDGVSISYGKLLLATGGTPKNLSLFTSAPDQAKAKTSVYRNIPDYLALDDLVGRVESIVIVGGGFLGSELAVAMASRGKPRGLKVTQVFPEDGNLGLILPTTLCKWTTAKVRKEGVEVLPNTVLKGVALEGEKVKLTTQDDREVTENVVWVTEDVVWVTEDVVWVTEDVMWVTEDVMWVTEDVMWVTEDVMWVTEDVMWVTEDVMWVTEDVVWVTEDVVWVTEEVWVTEDVVWVTEDVMWVTEDVMWVTEDVVWVTEDVVWVTEEVWVTEDVVWVTEDVMWVTEDVMWVTEDVVWVTEDVVWVTEEVWVTEDVVWVTEDVVWVTEDVVWVTEDVVWVTEDVVWVTEDVVWVTEDVVVWVTEDVVWVTEDVGCDVGVVWVTEDVMWVTEDVMWVTEDVMWVTEDVMWVTEDVVWVTEDVVWVTEDVVWVTEDVICDVGVVWVTEDVVWVTEDVMWVTEDVVWVTEDVVWVTEDVMWVTEDVMWVTEDVVWVTEDVVWVTEDVVWLIEDVVWLIEDVVWVTKDVMTLCAFEEVPCDLIATYTDHSRSCGGGCWTDSQHLSGRISSFGNRPNPWRLFGGTLNYKHVQMVWAAGDVACFYDPQLGRRRVEHHDHAFVSGGLAGRNMAGDHQHFKHQSMFWSDIGKEVGFEATGLVDSRLPTVSLFAKIGEDAALPSEDFSKGVVFYLSENSRRVVGVLTWNIFGKMDLAREIITEKKTEADIGQLASKFEIQ